MGTGGWRKALCTSIPRDSPPQPEPPAPALRCRTKHTSALPPPPTTTSSAPCSPRSPSKLALLKLRLYRSCCGVCLKSTKAGQGMAVLTAECSHAFHLPCIAAHTSQSGALICPVCAANWGPVPVLSEYLRSLERKPDHVRGPAASRAYDDDEPLVTPRCGAIPEAAEEMEEVVEVRKLEPNSAKLGTLQAVVAPCVLPLATGRSHDKYVIALKLKAPPAPMPRRDGSGSDPSRRAPIDLVAVLDVGGSMSGAKMLMLKRAVRLVVSSLSPADRLAIVGAAAVAKRLLPLSRMTPRGQRSARRVVDGLLACDRGGAGGAALRKATRVLEDRRERNPVASIMLLSDSKKQPPPRAEPAPLRRLPTFPQHRHPQGTRFAHLEIPVSDGDGDGAAEGPSGDAFAKCVGGLLSVVAQDVRLQLGFSPGEVVAVYSCGAQPASVGVGGGSVRLGDLYAEEERELLVEVVFPADLRSREVSLDVRCCYRDPGAQDSAAVVHVEQPIQVTLQQHLPSPPPEVECLRNAYVTTRATVESRRLAELGDFGTASRLLVSARALLLRSACASGEEGLAVLEAVGAEVREWREERKRAGPREPLTPSAHRRAWEGNALDGEGEEALTPTSAWRAAEKLAKVAIMRKTMNRIGDLHGFENARF